jgi:hypothetical protein
MLHDPTQAYSKKGTSKKFGAYSQEDDLAKPSKEETGPLARRRKTGYGAVQGEVKKLEKRFKGPTLKSLWLFGASAGMAVLVLATFCFMFWTYTSYCWVVFAICMTTCAALYLIGYKGGYPGEDGYSGFFFKFTGFCAFCMCLVGLLLGFYGFLTYVKSYDIYENSAPVTQVSPSANPGAYRDAATITFAPGVRVNTDQGVGYRAGVDYCVAPLIVGTGEAKPFVSFWAAGTDCCRHKGGFNCGDVSATSGLVVLDASPDWSEEIPFYHKAAQQSAALFDLEIPAEPIFVYMTNNIEASINQYNTNAWVFVLISTAIIFFFMLGVVACCNGLNTATNSGQGDKPEVQ